MSGSVTSISHPITHRSKKKKYSKDNLLRFVECDEHLLTPALKGTKTRAQRGVCAFYGYLPMEFPRHYVAFRNIHDQEVAPGQPRKHPVSDEFEMTAMGFINFIIDVGPIPSSLQNPILVRRDPEKGYISGNMKWVNAKVFRPVSAKRARTFVRPR